MSTELKQLEKKIAFQYLEDGVWDIYLALIVLSFGLGILLDQAYLSGVMVPIGLALHQFIKSRITYPRIGYIKLKHARKRAVASVLTGVMVAGLLVFIPFALGMDNSLVVFLKANILWFIAIIWGGAVALAGLSFQVKRFYAYGAIVFAGVAASNWVGDLGLNLLIVGVMVLLAGVVVLQQFIRKYPVVSEQD